MTKLGFLGVILAAVVAACGGNGPAPATGVIVAVHAEPLVAGTSITKVTLIATPGGVTQDLTYNAAAGAWKGTLALSAGTYTITADAYAAAAKVATGSAQVTIVAGQTAQLEMGVLDTTGPVPPPRHAPVIASFTVPATLAVVGDKLHFVASATTGWPDDPITYAWSVSPAGCGSFDDASTAGPVWTALVAGECTVSVKATAPTSIAGQDVKSATVSTANGPNVGGVAVTANYVPHPEITQIALIYVSPSLYTYCSVSRTATDGTCSSPITGTMMFVDITYNEYLTTLDLASSCGGQFFGASSGLPMTNRFQWNVPSGPVGTTESCVLTATATREGMTDTFPIAVYVKHM